MYDPNYKKASFDIIPLDIIDCTHARNISRVNLEYGAPFFQLHCIKFSANTVQKRCIIPRDINDKLSFYIFRLWY